MIIKIAWRNIWRSPLRSGVVMAAIALGLLAGTFSSAFNKGMMEQKVQNVIQLEMSHVQVHDSSYRDQRLSKFIMPKGDVYKDSLLALPEVAHGAARLVFDGCMLASSRKTGGVRLVGIDPEVEKDITTLSTFMTEGDYLAEGSGKKVIMSERMRDRYKVKLRSKMTVTLLSPAGKTVVLSLRVGGFFNTHNGPFDEVGVYIERSHLAKELGLTGQAHEIALILKDVEQSDAFAEKLNGTTHLEVLSWKDLSTGMRYMLSMMDSYQFIIVGIILLALMFGIVNTMLMAVLDRVREFGVLMAVGMTRSKVFTMVMLETIFMCLTGTPIGLLAGYGIISQLGKTGIDLGSTGDVYSDLGFSSVVYPKLDGVVYGQIAIMVVIMAIIAAILPAIKALRLKPVEAIRKI